MLLGIYGSSRPYRRDPDLRIGLTPVVAGVCMQMRRRVTERQSPFSCIDALVRLRHFGLAPGVQSNSSDGLDRWAASDLRRPPLRAGSDRNLYREARNVCNRLSLLWCRSNAAAVEASSRWGEAPPRRIVISRARNTTWLWSQPDARSFHHHRPRKGRWWWPEVDKSPSTTSHSK